MVKFKNKQECLEWVKNQPFNLIIEEYSNLLMEKQNRTDKILLTEEQFKEFFRIKGFNENGEKENRGRKPL